MVTIKEWKIKKTFSSKNKLLPEIGSFPPSIDNLLGCKDFNGPRKAISKPKPDLPEYSIEEQQRRGRDKYTIPEDNFRTGPNLNIDRPSPTGR